MASCILSTVIVFHSYPKKPCVDGLMAAIIATKMQQQKNASITLIPYWRTDECFQKIKNVIQTKLHKEKTVRVIYVDCTPDLPQEVEYLKSILNKVCIEVFDHHPCKVDSPVNELIGLDNFVFTYDGDNCASKMMYKNLSEEQRNQLEIDELITVIQFSEYEGMDLNLAEKERSKNLSRQTFEFVMKNSINDHSLIKNLKKILHLEMELFFLLDHILADSNQWSFLYDQRLNDDKRFYQFQETSFDYIKTCKEVLLGKNTSVFSESNTRAYLNMFDDMIVKLNTKGVIFKETVDDKMTSIYCVSLDIFDYGRSLEPCLRAQMEKNGAAYAVCMNSPTPSSTGEESHYFSLRRQNENYDARSLVKFILNHTGSEIGGGHPWASGVTLNKEQYLRFLDLIH